MERRHVGDNRVAGAPVAVLGGKNGQRQTLRWRGGVWAHVHLVIRAGAGKRGVGPTMTWGKGEPRDSCGSGKCFLSFIFYLLSSNFNEN